MGSQQKKKKRTKDTRSMVAEIKRTQDLDANALAIQPTHERGYSPVGINTTDFVNVTTVIGPSQTVGLPAPDITPPAQVTGLAVAVTIPAQLNLTWNPNTEPDLNHYNVYRGTVNGFTVTPGTTVPIATPTSNSYNNSGLAASTTYYYRVLAADNTGNLGALSAQAQGTTQAPDVTPPAQTTGLNVTPVSSSQLGLSWTASIATDFNHYNVYRGTTAGFSVVLGTTTPTATPTANSLTDSGLTASTTYYYKVSAVDSSGNIGALSTEDSATTLPPGAVSADIILTLDNNFNDTSGNAFTINGSTTNGFVTPGAFGTHAWRCNTPVQPPVVSDALYLGGQGTIPTALEMDTTIGFSFSIWINPQDLSALAFRRVVAEKSDDINNKWTIQIDSSGICYFFVKKAGTDYKAQVSGFTTGAWQHIAATFNGATNTPIVYRNAVAGTSSTAATQYPGNSLDWFVIGYRFSNAGGDGDDLDTHSEAYLDEIKYYKGVVLTPTQVTNLKNTNTA